MSKNNGIYIDRNETINIVKETLRKKWEKFQVSELYQVGNAMRCDITIDDKKSSIDFFFRKDGTTSMLVVGKNTEIAQYVKITIESNVDFSSNAKAKSCSFKKVPIEWSNKLIQFLNDNPKITIVKSDIEKPKHIEYAISSAYGDKITISIYPNKTILLQGKPAYIFSEAISFLSYCNDISTQNIIDGISCLHYVNVETDDVNSQLEFLLKNSYSKLDPIIIKLLSPSVALRKISIELYDYSCFAFPALRALEAYIKWLLAKKGVAVGRSFAGIFYGYNLTTQVCSTINDSVYQSEIEKVFKYFKDNRHVYFHTEQVLIDTALIQNRSEADSIINSVINLIETSISIV